jgi:ricin-type beta-trefoil lectin protein
MSACGPGGGSGTSQLHGQWVWKDTATGFCLDSNGDQEVYTLACNGGNYQRWNVWYTGANGYQIKNVSTGFCLDSNSDRDVYSSLSRVSSR